MGKITLKVKSIDEMKEIARKISEILRKQDIVALKGDLGAGKTTFSKFIINAKLQQNDNITSPTFNLVSIYENSDDVIWHFDLYRLKFVEEVYETGIEEAFENVISIIEWPEVIMNSMLSRKVKTSEGQYIQQILDEVLIINIREDVDKSVRILDFEYNNNSKWSSLNFEKIG